MNWELIDEDTPKDREILVGRFTGDPKADHEGHVRVDAWQDLYKGFGHFNKSYWPPTHWMEIPSAPRLTPPSTRG